MLFLSGPSQVGKTTSACKIAQKLSKKWIYLNWDNQDHREIILSGPIYYIRGLEKKVVDFLISKDDEPFFLVEVKNSNDKGISKNLHIFKEMTGTKHAFQVVLQKEFEDINCFDYSEPIIVSAKTLLSQLV